MNPLSGPKTIEKFYQRFEDHCPGESGKGLNFFFSDELQFGIRGFLWNDQFPAEFKKRTVSGEKYKILVLPAMSAVRYSTIEKALDFYRSGGIVIAVGMLREG